MKKNVAQLRLLIIGIVLTVLGGCQTYNAKIENVESLFYNRRYKTAARLARKAAAKRDNEQLLYYMELGIIEHTAGNYEKSNKALFRAKELLAILDAFSVTKEAASYVGNALALPYRGEDFESVLVNTYLGMNYLLMGEYEDALVEFKLVNIKLEEIQQKRKQKYKFNLFSMYLIGLCYELEGYLDDAYVEYRRLYKLAPKLDLVRQALLETAYRLDYQDDLKRWQKEFSVGTLPNYQKSAKLVLLYQAGKAPIKVPRARKGFASTLPRYQRRPADYYKAALSTGQKEELTVKLNDIEEVSIRNLDEKMAGIIAKKMAGYGVKGAISYGVARALTKKNDWQTARLTACLFHLFSRLEQADLRCWHTLPATLNIALMRVPAGEYEVGFNLINNYGTRKRRRMQKVTVDGGQTAILNLRSTQ